MHALLLSCALAIVTPGWAGSSDAEDQATAESAIDAFHESVEAFSDEFESSSAYLEERAFAVVITVEDDAVGQFEEFVDRLGSKATRDCVLAVTSPSYPDATHNVTVRNDADMLSDLDEEIPARHLDVNVEDLDETVHILGVSVSVAVVGRSLVAVVLIYEGVIFSDF